MKSTPNRTVWFDITTGLAAGLVATLVTSLAQRPLRRMTSGSVQVPALGLSAPNHRYPAFTRVRGLAAHLIYGATVAVMAEGLGRLLEAGNS